MAKVSIIVPIYNVEKYLPKCLDSLINQTFKDIEIWAISDGSPDNSVDIIKKYAKKDKRVKCIEKENGGYGSVLEYAIKNIKTDYFLVCDPDDWLAENAIEVLYNKAIKNNLDIVYGSYYIVYSNDNEEVYTNGIVNKYFVPKSNIVYEGNDAFKFFFLSPTPHAKLYRTKITKNIEFPHKISFTDFILYVISVINSKRIMHVDDALAYYLVDREGNSVSDINPKIADYHYQVYMSIVSQYEKSGVYAKDFYYRMFLNYFHVTSQIGKIENMDNYKEKAKLIEKTLQVCVKHRKEIKPYLKDNPIRKKIAYKLLLNPMTSHFAYLYFSKRIYNSTQKKKKIR